jgi:flagellar FliJ protein
LKKFRFKLEALLRMRRIEEERALGGLAKIMLRVNEHESVRKLAFRMLREEMDRFDREYKDNVDLTLWQIYDRYVDRLNAEASQAAGKLEAIRPELEKEMAKVMEARRKRRVVEIMKERARSEYDVVRRKDERRELEEANRRSITGAGGYGATGARHETGRIYVPAGTTAGLDQPTRPGQNRRTRDRDTDSEDLAGTVEPEVPQPEPDYVSEYFKRMGLGEPPGH